MSNLDRIENVREVDIDGVQMIQSFRPGDIVKALIISLGDARQFLLSTSRKELGVVYAKSVAGMEVLPTPKHCTKLALHRTCDGAGGAQ